MSDSSATSTADTPTTPSLPTLAADGNDESSFVLSKRSWVAFRDQIEGFQEQHSPRSAFSHRQYVVVAGCDFPNAFRTTTMDELLTMVASASSNAAAGAAGADDDEPVLWFDVRGATADERTRIGRALGLNSVLLSALEHEHEHGQGTGTLETTKIFRNVLYTSLMDASQDDDGAHHPDSDYSEVKIVATRRFLLTFHKHDMRRSIYTLLYRLKHGIVHSSRLTTSWLLAAFLDAQLERLVYDVERLSSEVESLESLVVLLSVGEQMAMMSRIGMTSKQSCVLHKLLWSKRNAIDTLLSNDVEVLADADARTSATAGRISGEDRAYLKDMLSKILSSLHQLESLDDLLHHLTSAYLSKVNIELLQQHNDQLRATQTRMTQMFMLSAGALLLASASIVWRSFSSRNN